MRPPLRQSVKFYLSVEGETERWYFEHLRNLVNSSPCARYRLTLQCGVETARLFKAWIESSSRRS